MFLIKQRKKLSDATSISLGNTTILVSTSAQNLGFIFDSDMSLTGQVNLFCKSSHLHISDIMRISHPNPPFVAITRANFRVEQAWLLQFIIFWHQQTKHPETPASSQGFGFDDVALRWFCSYLTGLSQHVQYGGVMSTVVLVSCGVPQGSVLGPVLFLVYSADAIAISDKHGFSAHV